MKPDIGKKAKNLELYCLWEYKMAQPRWTSEMKHVPKDVNMNVPTSFIWTSSY